MGTGGHCHICGSHIYATAATNKCRQSFASGGLQERSSARSSGASRQIAATFRLMVGRCPRKELYTSLVHPVDVDYKESGLYILNTAPLEIHQAVKGIDWIRSDLHIKFECACT